MIPLASDHIVSNPGRRGGKPYITGKDSTVQHIAPLHKPGWIVQDLTEECE